LTKIKWVSVVAKQDQAERLKYYGGEKILKSIENIMNDLIPTLHYKLKPTLSIDYVIAKIIYNLDSDSINITDIRKYVTRFINNEEYLVPLDDYHHRLHFTTTVIQNDIHSKLITDRSRVKDIMLSEEKI